MLISIQAKIIIKISIITLLHFVGDYRVLTIKKCLKIYKKYYHETINKLKYVLFQSREWS
jgi:hypothetical protein